MSGVKQALSINESFRKIKYLHHHVLFIRAKSKELNSTYGEDYGQQPYRAMKFSVF